MTEKKDNPESSNVLRWKSLEGKRVKHHDIGIRPMVVVGVEDVDLARYPEDIQAFYSSGKRVVLLNELTKKKAYLDADVEVGSFGVFCAY